MAEVGHGAEEGGRHGSGGRGGGFAFPGGAGSRSLAVAAGEVPVKDARRGGEERLGVGPLRVGQQLESIEPAFAHGDAGELAVPVVALLTASADSHGAGALCGEAFHDRVLHRLALHRRGGIGKVFQVKGHGTLGGVFLRRFRRDRDSEVDRLVQRHAQARSDHFVDAVVLEVIPDELDDEVLRVKAGLRAGDTDGPADLFGVAVPATHEGVDRGVGINAVEIGDGFDRELFVGNLEIGRLELFKAAPGLQPESVFPELDSFHLFKDDPGGAKPGFIRILVGGSGSGGRTC